MSKTKTKRKDKNTKKKATVKKAVRRRAIGRGNAPQPPPELTPPAEPDAVQNPPVEPTTETKQLPEAKEPVGTYQAANAVAVVTPPPTGVPEINYPHELPIGINHRLFQTLQEFLASAHAGGDYTFVSLSDLVREALRDHLDGLIQIHEAQVEPGKNKRTSIRVDAYILDHWNTLPLRKRTEILERILRVKLKHLTQG